MLKIIFILFCFFSAPAFSVFVSPPTQEQAFIVCASQLATSYNSNWSCVSRTMAVNVEADGYVGFSAQYTEPCAAGENETGTACAIPPPTDSECSSEPPKDINFPMPTGPDGEMMICIGICTTTVTVDGCSYTVSYGGTGGGDDGVVDQNECSGFNDLDGTPMLSCSSAVSDSATSEGAGTQEAQVNDGTEPLNNPNEQSDPCIGINGLNICNSDTTDCAMINGVETCLSTEPNCGTVNGQRVCANDEKNCGEVNGETVCITEQVPTLNTHCMAFPESCVKEPFPQPTCLFGTSGPLCVKGKTGVKETTETQVKTSTDGSVVKTVTTTDNVKDSTPKQTITVTKTDGTETTTQSGGQPHQSEADGNAKEGNDLLREIRDGQKTGNDILNDLLGAPEDYDSTTFGTQLSDKSQSVADELLTSITNFENPFSNLSLLNTSDWLPSLPTTSCSGGINTTIFGRPFVLEPCEKLQPLRDVLAWVFFVYTIISIFRTVFSIANY